MTKQKRNSRAASRSSGAVSGVCTAIACIVMVCLAGCRKRGHVAQEQPEFEIDKAYSRGPLGVHVRIDKRKITLADTLWLEFETAIAPAYDVNMPEVDSVLANFGIVDWRELGNRLDANDNVVSTRRYRLEPFLSGTFALGAFTFKFRDVNEQSGRTYELVTEPVDIEVTSLLGEQRGDLTIADIADVVDMPEKTDLWWLVPAGAVVAAAGGLLLHVRRKRATAAVRIFKPAHEIAYARMRSLIKRDLVKAGKVKEFYEAVSNILRHYIEDRFELKAPERTTEEFLFEIRNTNLLSEADGKALTEFLTHCDLVKFAKHSPTKDQIQHTFDLARNFIEQTKSEERRIDVTDRAEPAIAATGGEA